MIPRYQRVLFWSLSAAVVLMALFLLRGCAQAREKFTRPADQTPLAAPLAAPTEPVRLAVADDATGTLHFDNREIALPADPSSRIRVLLTGLLAEYSYNGSRHPLESRAAVEDVFLLDLPLRPAASSSGRARPQRSFSNTAEPSDSTGRDAEGGQLAVISLVGAFADKHPSGVEPESLTIASILATIHANVPRVEQVRFLVDGRPRDTLNGHADLTRTYSVTDAFAVVNTGDR